MCALRADGREHPREHDVVARHLAALGASPLGGVRLVEDAARRVRLEGARAVATECAASLPTEHRERALSALLEVVVADRRISREERELFALVDGLLGACSEAAS